MENQEVEIRRLIIDALMELSDDEYELKEDILMLAKESQKDLIIRLIDCAKWYKNSYIFK